MSARGHASGAIALTAAAWLALWPGTASAITCQVRLVPVDFGIYMPLQSAPLDVTGSITVRCMAQPGSYAVTLGPGTSGDFTARTLSAGAAGVLLYNLFRDPARVQIWGDGTPPTFTVAGSRASRGRPTETNHPLYGRIFPDQAPEPGVYTDNLLVTVLF